MNVIGNTDSLSSLSTKSTNPGDVTTDAGERYTTVDAGFTALKVLSHFLDLSQKLFFYGEDFKI